MILGLATGIVPLRIAVLVGWLAASGSSVVCLHHLGLQSACIFALRLGCRGLLKLAGHWSIPIANGDDVFRPGGCPKIIVSNHVSNMEILHLLSLPFQDASGNPVVPVFVMKETVFEVPFVGPIARDVMGCIEVPKRKRANAARENPSVTSESRSDSCTEQILARVRDGKSGPIVIFAEGTTTNGTCLLAFKKGAFAPMVPVWPVLYRFGASAYDPARSAFLPTYESIWGPAYLWRLFAQPVHRFSCEFLAPIAPPSVAAAPMSNTTDSPSVFAEHVRSEMARHGNLPMVSSMYDYNHKLKYHDGLTKAFLSHPRGPKYAMCFEPMLPVFPEPSEGLPADRPGPYDCVVGTKPVDAAPLRDGGDRDSDAARRDSREKKEC